MAKCISCGREIPEKEEKIYGVIRKHHYDNRYSTADIDTGPTDFTPVALIRIGVCPDCNRSLGTGKIRAAAGLLLGGVAVTGITLYISFHSDSEYIGAGVLLGLVMTVFGLIGLIRAAAAKLTAKEQNAPSAVSGMLKPEWIVYPPAEDGIEVKDVTGATVGRNHYEHLYIPEKELRKPADGKGKKDSKAAAVDALRTWAKENRLFE